MSERTWKDHLLSSGLPLEYSVAKIYDDAGTWSVREFKYERNDVSGFNKVFSIDVRSRMIDSWRGLWLETLIECKYRHDSVKWVFVPARPPKLFESPFENLFVILDQYNLEHQINLETLTDTENPFAVCAKGIELLQNDANSKTITQALQQLRHAIAAAGIDAMRHQVDEMLGKPDPLFALVPIIVTTAELWRLKPGATVDYVRGAEKLEEVASAFDALIVNHEADRLDIKEIRERFHANFSEEQIRKFDLRLKETFHYEFDFFVELFAHNQPSYFLVVRYNKLKSIIEDLQSRFSSDVAIVERKRARQRKPKELKLRG